MATMTTTPDWLAPFGPRLATDELVVELNRIFHRFEAADYDRRHPEIHAQLPSVWREMIAESGAAQGCGLRVLDFGCGTGFAAEQVLTALPIGSIDSLVCYDLSPEMLDRCQAKLRRFSATRFTSAMDDVLAAGPYDLLLTNSLLHHLPQPLETIAELASLVAPGGAWLAGHEPSNRFFRNAECVEHYERYGRQRRRRTLSQRLASLRPSAVWSKLRQSLGSTSPKRRTAQAAFEAGLFAQPPSPRVIDRLVDFHVAHSVEEAGDGRGFDLEVLAADLADDWMLRKSWSYSYLGPHAETSLSPAWQRACRELAARHPNDGANVSAVWRRREAT